MRELPLISILVPVYNTGRYLRRFLDSAVQQTYPNIEIICIDNLSEDDSYEILMEYQRLYPDKLFVYQAEEHYDYVGAGRNIAYSHSRGEYLYFCDSDDIIQYKAIEMLYNAAFTYNSDLVCGYATAVLVDDDGLRRYTLGFKRNQRASNEAAITSGVELWMRLISRSLFEEAGAHFPEDVTFDDVAQLTVIQSYAHNIRFIQYPVYYYFRRTNSAAGTPSLDVSLTSIKAERYALEHCNPKYRGAVLKFIAMRIKSNLDLRWQYTDYFIDWLKELMPQFENEPLVANDKTLFPRLEFLGELENEKLPRRIYLSSMFGKELTQECVNDMAERGFAEGCEVVVLDDSCCSAESDPYIRDAIEKGEYDLAECYFALKAIYENGGVYLHESVELVNCLNFCTYLGGFFGFADKRTYTDRVFGAAAGNEAFRALLNTFSYGWDKKGSFMPLSERIGIILTAVYDIPLNGRACLYKKCVSALPPNMLVADLSGVFEELHCMTRLTSYSSECVTVPKDTLRILMDNAAHQTAASVLSGGKTPREKVLERELYNIKMSNTWKIVEKLRRTGDGPFGPFLKKIFHGLLKIRAKLKK